MAHLAENIPKIRFQYSVSYKIAELTLRTHFAVQGFWCMQQDEVEISNDRVVVTDDWTRNWQAKIAIKITAMFLWVIILCGFGVVIYLTEDFGSHVNEEIAHDIDALAYQVQSVLSASQLEDADEFRPKLGSLFSETLKHNDSEVVSHGGISGIRLVTRGHTLEFGHIDETTLDSDRRNVIFSTPGRDGKTESAEIQAFFTPFDQIGDKTRQQLVISVVVVILVFGVLLRLMIQNVLAKPFQVLMDAIQGVSRGDLSLRLDVSRQDEFGHLSRFFNQMLERVQSQQEKLTEANQDLVSEIAVRKEAEQKLRAHQDELEKVIEERTRDLAVARDQALAASQTKSAFIANISHEIRTPLTPIIGFAEAMLNGNQAPDEQEQHLRTIIRNGRHLSHIINEILDLSKIEANSLDIEQLEVNPFTVLSDVEAVVRVLAEEKGLEFELDFEFPIPTRILSDPTRLKQILMNLATNAIKFTSKGQIRVSTRYAADDGQLLITVSDTGIGIAREKITRLFQPFSQADYSTTRRYGGTGLGLYISKRMANILGGDIKLESLEGVGSRFTMSVSVGDVQNPEFVHERPDTMQDDLSDLKRADAEHLSGNILLAEDSPDIQRLMLYFLQRTGAEVTPVENGKLAVEAALQNNYDLILMDMQMPVMGGIEAVKVLRSAGCAAPIVALTANAMKEDRESYDAIGCDGFLPKPVDQNQLCKVLHQYLQELSPQENEQLPVQGLNEVDRFTELVAQFRTGLGDYASRLRSALTENKLDTARELAHQLKGMGSSFGYPEITDISAQVDKALKDGGGQQGMMLGMELIKLLEKSSLPAEDELSGEAMVSVVE